MQSFLNARRLAVNVITVGFLVFLIHIDAGARTSANDLFEVEQRLAGMGYPVLRVDGVADASTYHAIIAFQKVEGLRRTGKIGGDMLEALRFARRPTARFGGLRSHIEIDVTRQVLFVTDETGKVVYVLPVSTGNDKPYIDKGQWQIAHTPRGRFRIERKINGTRISSLGPMYYPSYFYLGVAIHGSSFVPPYPASHGCVRIPRFAEKKFFVMAPAGMEVFVYD